MKTIEENTSIAPYSITIGVYGALFHTHFTSTKNEAQQYASEIAEKIEVLLTHILIEDESSEWRTKYNELLDKIVE